MHKMPIKPRKASKSPAILSHEFFIQNHPDIVSCIAMVFIIGLMIQATSSLAFTFIGIHHNVTQSPEFQDPNDGPLDVLYTYGIKDLCTIFYYCLICIIMHAILQEYFLDKVTKKLHLSKAKHSKFNESGQLLVFYLISIVWGIDIILRQNLLLNVTSLWEGYPHSTMMFTFKFYFIVQLSYWVHCFPELYFQKVKREEMSEHIQTATLGIVAISAIYLLNLNRVGICLLTLHYMSEALYHVARIVDYLDKDDNGSKGTHMASNSMFVLVRLGSIILSVLTFWYGLALSDNQIINVAEGNFNTKTVRLSVLASICAIQAYFMWNFITEQLQQMREQKALDASSKPKAKIDKKTVKKIKKEEKREDDDLPEVDQNTKKTLRTRAAAKAK
ncbi:translocating chain-associated membrane protein 1 [Thrips palmi]|uniref:Translocating chain-associated membrane protein 1 n=1 Tax=Thrips palmi TaxID=161013 RepID=A0A6P9A484_THRPL|nr:translocating chain-associated membrane protein 1 [Thrips palmi]